MTHTIAEIGTAICRLEGLEGSAATFRAGELRTLTQRLPFMPNGKQWRADTYAQETAAALRVVQIAADVGLGRPELHSLTSHFNAPDFLAPLAPVPGGFTRPTMAQTMLARVKAGETFSIFLDRTATGQTIIRPDWAPHNPQGRAFADSVFESAGAEPDVIASVELKASRIVADLLRELES